MLEQKWNKNWKFWEDKDSFALVWMYLFVLLLDSDV